MWTKQLFDVVFSVIMLIILFPIMVLVAAILLVTSGPPIFYRSKRIGQNRRKTNRRKSIINMHYDNRNGETRILDLKGRPFYMLKFRTMIQGADQLGGSITYNNDPRVTKIGTFLRKTKIDELPSLINVIKGEMSIVGPRPESPEWVAKYGDSEKEILRIKPGITGSAQIKYRNEESLLTGDNIGKEYMKIMYEKLAIDKEYINNWSISEDFHIIAKTIVKLLHNNFHT